MSCSASGVWVGRQHAVPHMWPWWVFLLQCDMALDFTLWGTSGHARRPPVVTPWAVGPRPVSKLRDRLPVSPRQQNGGGRRE